MSLTMRALIGIAALITLAGCITAERKAQMDEERLRAAEQKKQMCAALRADLPEKDSYFDLKGKVKYDTGWGNTATNDIIQFGRQDKYYQYQVESPNCGRFGLYQVKTITREGSGREMRTIRFSVVLKNGKSFETRTNVPFCWRNLENPGVCNVLMAGAVNDKEKNFHFRYLFSDPSARKPVEAAIDHMLIQQLEIF